MGGARICDKKKWNAIEHGLKQNKKELQSHIAFYTLSSCKFLVIIQERRGGKENSKKKSNRLMVVFISRYLKFLLQLQLIIEKF